MIENTQRAVPADHQPSGDLYVHSIFKTIQGEGPFCGERALFIRLWGCNLQCPGCDTEYTRHKVAFSAPALVSAVKHAWDWPQGALIVLTGGEPFRQNIGPAIRALLDAGYRVQIETNGILWCDTLPGCFDKRLSIVCAPKTKKIHEEVYRRALAFKYVVSAGDVNPDDGLPNRALRHKAAPHVARPRPGALVYVQPMDEQDETLNALNLEAAVKSTMEHGYRLQLQIHKIIDME
jgi:organic radical activating enzyme